MKDYSFRGVAARERRERLGLSSRDVAAIVGVTQAHVLHLESGRCEPSTPLFFRVCAALDIDPDELREEREPGKGAA